MSTKDIAAEFAIAASEATELTNAVGSGLAAVAYTILAASETIDKQLKNIVLSIDTHER